MKIPKESIPKFLVAFVILIVVILVMTKNTDELSAPDFNFNPEITDEGLMEIPEGDEETVETTTTTTPTTTTTSTTTTSAPATTTYVSSCYPSLSGRKDTKFNGVVLSWTACSNSDDFQFYKVVKSGTNSNPSYPNDSVVMSSANPGTNNYLDKTVARSMTYYYRVCVVQRLNKVTCGNTISLTY